MSSKSKHKMRSRYRHFKDSYNFQYGQSVTGRWAALDAMKKRQRNAVLNGVS